ncbi:DNA gyrase inhibitor YacG [Afipia sp. TerB]
MKLCPICKKPSTEASRPFCSERCRDVDLHRWLSGAYAIPTRDGDEEDEDGAAEPLPRPPRDR